MPKVSVIVLVYKAEHYIERCVRSLFEQTLDDIEYIFVDDCTPDNSIYIIKNILLDYPNRKDQVIIHKMNQNSGQAIARKCGIEKSTGDFIIHCDSDDWVEKNMYLEMYQKAIMQKADVAICDYSVTDAISKFITIKACHANTPKKFLEKCLFQKDPWSLCNKLYKKELYSNIEFPKSSVGEDLAITIQLFEKINKICYIPKVFYYYFQNPNSTIHQSSEDLIVARFNQLQDNVNIVIKHLEKSEKYSDLLFKVKPLLLMNACSPLLGLFEIKKYRYMWRSLCPHLSLWYLIKTPFSLYLKISYIIYSLKFKLKK